MLIFNEEEPPTYPVLRGDEWQDTPIFEIGPGDVILHGEKVPVKLCTVSKLFDEVPNGIPFRYEGAWYRADSHEGVRVVSRLNPNGPFGSVGIWCTAPSFIGKVEALDMEMLIEMP